MTQAAISVRGLRKSYGALEAVAGVDIDVARGEVFALLGPNGAGKTTTVEILEGYRPRSAGDVNVMGHDPGRNEVAFKRKIGIVLQDTGVSRFLTVSEVIDQFRGYFPDPLPLEEIIEVVELREKKDTLVRKLSGGQQRRLDVAVGLAGNPDLLFLDEPTTGFDPSARRNAWTMVHNLKALGKTVLLTTHYMDEAHNLADNVAIIAKGKIVAQGPPATLGGADLRRTTVSFEIPGSVALPEVGAVRSGKRVSVVTDEPERLLHRLTTWSLAEDIPLEGLNVSPPSLEDVYLRLTGDEEAAAS